ncbi:GNAT family N-acetyltransferase [Serratia symbiotica]|uniref:GNAT family N-acetyltransferase n=1 Tax=Serratia symbiotica TaxID=138074 RepID=UPI00191C06E7|nr:GNAT family N-acetyltransferase [Serratia symbiotica]
MLIRPYKPGEELTLRKVFHSAVHHLAHQYYSPEQINAWAPNTYDVQEWNKRINILKPFVAEINGNILGYADLQPSGYIDHFFVTSSHARQGIGNALMLHLQ